MASRSTVKRLGAAILGAGLVLMSALPAAAAGDVKVQPDKSADQPGMGVYLERGGKPVELPRHKTGDPINAELIGLKIVEGGQGQTARAYCVELPTPLYDGRQLEEVPWDQHPNPNTSFKQNAGKINWVLQNSYPAIEDPADAYKLYGLDPANKPSILIAAAQAAVWHFSDGVDLRKGDSTAEAEDVHGGTVDELVYKIYEYLTTKAEDIKDVKPNLGIEPSVLKGQVGSTFGPFVITTTADEVQLITSLPKGVTLVDKDGSPFKTVKAGEITAASSSVKASEVWVKVGPDVEPGDLDLVVKAGAKLRSGRLFVSSNPKQETQSLVIATSEPVNVEVPAKAEWVENVVVTTTTEATTTTSPTTTTTTAAATTTTTAVATGGDTDELASTGASIFVPLLIGLGLLGAGTAALIIVRRKRAA
ncbi:thioester domain-containing protein [Actinosynnema sp. NPDC053489]|uniref:thioester domain-containing protein n=1 Tax=Actinosynnema sp. NPDC053489 TaxID=3363916 RepID=UPI0037C7273F